MKRHMKCILLTLLWALLLACGAQATGGLDSFTESRSMGSSTFTDVKTSHWFYSGVKAAYDLGIMEGVGGGRFAPDQTVPWSQAVTIAARVRAAYVGEEIPAVEGEWYRQYVSYAQSCGILPDTHPEGADWNTAAIDRQSIAYLFQAVVDSGDCTAISDLDIPDLAAVDSNKQAAVQTLYAAGIFTGRDDGSFDPTGLTTRAELATILNRLLRPAYRVAHDSRINASMAGQESNFMHSGGLCHDEDAVYLIYRDWSYDESGTLKHTYSILRRDKATGVTATLYTSDGVNLKDLAIADGLLYFGEITQGNGRVLQSLDLSTGEVKQLCTTPDSNYLDYFIIYDGRIYTFQRYKTASYDFVYTLGELPLTGGTIRELAKYNAVSGLYGFNGKIYVLARYGGELHAYDLTTGKTELLLDGIEECVFQNGTAYFLLWNDHSYSEQMWMASLADMDRPVKYGTVPESALVRQVKLVHDGTDLYYIATSEGVLYRIVPGQVAKKVTTTRWKTADAPIIWDDCFWQANSGLELSNYIGEYILTTGIGTADMRQVDMDYWLGWSALMERVALPQSGAAFVSDEPMAEDETIAVRKAYYSGDALVLDVDYRNPDADADRELLYMDVTAEAGDVPLAQSAQVVHHISVSAGKTVKLTVVIQGEDLLATGVDLRDFQWELRASYRSKK